MLYLDFTVFFSPNILTLFQDSFQNITLHLTIISLQFSLVYDRSSIYSFFMTFDILGVLVRYFPCSGFDAVRTDKGKPHGHDLKRPAGGVCNAHHSVSCSPHCKEETDTLHLILFWSFTIQEEGRVFCLPQQQPSG